MVDETIDLCKADGLRTRNLNLNWVKKLYKLIFLTRLGAAVI